MLRVRIEVTEQYEDEVPHTASAAGEEHEGTAAHDLVALIERVTRAVMLAHGFAQQTIDEACGVEGDTPGIVQGICQMCGTDLREVG